MKNQKLNDLSDFDTKLLKTLLLYKNKISSHELSEKFGVSQSFIQQRRNLLEEEYFNSPSVVKNLKNLEYEHIDMKVYSGGGNTVAIAKKIKGNQIVEAIRNVGDQEVGSKIDVIIADNLELFPLIEQVKSLSELRGGLCSEIVEVTDERKSVQIGTIVSHMSQSEHMAVSFSNEIELEEMISNFFLRGLRQNMINFWIVTRKEAEHWMEILNKKGINANAMIESGDLVIADHDEVYSEISFGSSFNPIQERLHVLKDIVQGKQKTGINAIGTVAGNLLLQKRFSDCTNIEKNWHEIIESSEIPITLLCPYESTLKNEEKLALKESHNRGVINATLDKVLEINLLI